MRLVAALLLLSGCYPVCVTDADCDHGYCQIEGARRSCISCDPADRPCLDGQICAAINMCVPCESDDACGDGLFCSDDGTCQPVEMTDDGGAEDL